MSAQPITDFMVCLRVESKPPPPDMAVGRFVAGLDLGRYVDPTFMAVLGTARSVSFTEHSTVQSNQKRNDRHVVRFLYMNS